MTTLTIPARNLSTASVVVVTDENGTRTAVGVSRIDKRYGVIYVETDAGSVLPFVAWQTVTVLANPVAAVRYGMARDTRYPEVVECRFPTRERVRRELADYESAKDHGRHDDAARCCMKFAAWADMLRRAGVACERDGRGVRWSIRQTAELLLGGGHAR